MNKARVVLPFLREDRALKPWCRQMYKVSKEMFFSEGFLIVLREIRLEEEQDDTRDKRTKRYRMALKQRNMNFGGELSPLQLTLPP